MTTRSQIVLSATLVIGAVAAVGAYGALHRAPGATGATSEHVRAAGGAGASAQEPKLFSISEERARRIGVAYAVAHRSLLARTVRSVGTIAYDETRLANVDPKIEGWVDRLYVDYTGAPVRKGQPLMAIYSPMLVSAQEELILARHLADQAAADGATGATPATGAIGAADGAIGAAPAIGATRAIADIPANPAARNARELLAAARRRLSYWDIPDDEIARIERTGRTTKTIVLRSPADGVVTEKNVVQGARILPGMDVFKIADLSTVWLEGEVFEKELALVRVGQDARVTIDAFPGETFHGRVAFIAPSVDLESRTGTVRVALANPGGRLKPGMYAALQIDVPARTPALVVPRTAVLSTGERNIVFVRHDDGMLMPHEVRLGQAVGDTVEILSGLPEGATVVSSAGFLVDAESNLGAAMESMPGMEMGPAPAAPTQGKGNGKGEGKGTGTSNSSARPSPKNPASAADPTVPGTAAKWPGSGSGSGSGSNGSSAMPDMPGMSAAPGARPAAPGRRPAALPPAPAAVR